MLESINIGVNAMDEKMMISCTVCGKVLQRTNSGSDSDMVCPRCKAELNCIVSGQIVTIKLMRKPIKPIKVMS